jgi:calcium-dependent protein kinase
LNRQVIKRSKDKERFEKKKEEFDISKFVSDFTINRETFIRNREGDIKDHYEFGKKLGQGNYGVVYEGKEIDTGEMRAIKKLQRDKINNPKRFRNELHALRTLDHPNIIKLLEIFEDDTNIYLVQELCCGGELFDQIAKKDHFDEEFAASVFEQILKALWYSHKNKICHRDLKPENFMFSVDCKTIKLIDFGLSTSFFKISNTGERALLRMQTKVGTTFFMAPEVINGNYSNS